MGNHIKMKVLILDDGSKLVDTIEYNVIHACPNVEVIRVKPDCIHELATKTLIEIEPSDLE